MYTVSPKAIKTLDNMAVEEMGISELTLMKTAAKNAYEAFKGVLSSDSRILILCGNGNNGGDGYELANILIDEWYDVTVLNVFDCEPLSDAAKCVYHDCKKNGVKFVNVNEALNLIDKADIILDAIFGVGFYGSIDKQSDIGKLLCACNNSTAFKIAIDVPSGINSGDGTVSGACFEADMTATMAYYKTGMLCYPAREYCGETVVCNVGYPKEMKESIPFDALVPDDEYIKSVIPKRKPNTHKGTYGRLLMYVGSEHMTGAAILAAKGALRSGVGLVNIANDEKTLRVLQNILAEPVFSPLYEKTAKAQLLVLSGRANAFLVGCGIGDSKFNEKIVKGLIESVYCNIIIDADGINCLASNIMVLRKAKRMPIITPHPLEFARLTGKTVDEVQSNRLNLAKEFAKENNCIVVLKGASTVIASPERLAVNINGNAGLSKGGSGDVLAGVISSFVAQGTDPFDAAVAGVYLHGKAGDMLTEKISTYGLLPSDLPMEIAKQLP